MISHSAVRQPQLQIPGPNTSVKFQRLAVQAVHLPHPGKPPPQPHLRIEIQIEREIGLSLR
jgi:hypothetical protein